MNKLILRSPSLRFALLVGLSCDLLVYGISLHTHVRFGSLPITFLVLVQAMVLPLAGGLPLLELAKAVHSENLSEAARRLGDKAKAGIFEVWVFPSKEYSAWLQGRTVLISKAFVDTGTPEELEFVIAHEVAHSLRRRPESINVVAGVLIGVMVIYQALARNEIFSLWLWILGAAAVIALIWKFRRLAQSSPPYETELWCDRKAVELTGNTEAARSALEKIPHPGDPGSSSWGNYPELEQRLANLQGIL